MYYDLQFTNLSGHTCTIYDYPGVSAVNLAGKQVGSAAHHNSRSRPAVITLSYGATATAVLKIFDTGVFPPSRWMGLDCASAHWTSRRPGSSPSLSSLAGVPVPSISRCNR